MQWTYQCGKFSLVARVKLDWKRRITRTAHTNAQSIKRETVVPTIRPHREDWWTDHWARRAFQWSTSFSFPWQFPVFALVSTNRFDMNSISPPPFRNPQPRDIPQIANSPLARLVDRFRNILVASHIHIHIHCHKLTYSHTHTHLAGD